MNIAKWTKKSFKCTGVLLLYWLHKLPIFTEIYYSLLCDTVIILSNPKFDSICDKQGESKLGLTWKI